MQTELPRLSRLLLVATTAALALVASPAAAQYKWRDASGRMAYSDQPPPASVDPGRILSAPAGRQVGAPAAGVIAPGQALAERELELRKRLAEKAEQEKKALEASQRQLELARACADTRSDIRTLESGQRISRINQAGEHEFLSEAERAGRLKDARQNVAARC